jgi:hypothetical protein
MWSKGFLLPINTVSGSKSSSYSSIASSLCYTSLSSYWALIEMSSSEFDMSGFYRDDF